VPPPRGLGDTAACPHKGTAVARPLDQGAAATNRGTADTTLDLGIHRHTRSWATAVVACGIANEFGVERKKLNPSTPGPVL
jgi:hypothetical protein